MERDPYLYGQQPPDRIPRDIRDLALNDPGKPPIDFNLDTILNDTDIVELIKRSFPMFADLIPVYSRLNSLSFISNEAEKEWWVNEVELLVEKRSMEVDETDLAAWNFLMGMRFRLLFMINDAYKGHKSRSIREKRTVVGWEQPERQEQGGGWGFLRRR